MNLNLLITEHILPVPESAEIVFDYGMLSVIFEGKTEYGRHCVISDTEENIKNWLGKYDYFVKGSGIPAFEQFSICHIQIEKHTFPQQSIPEVKTIGAGNTGIIAHREALGKSNFTTIDEINTSKNYSLNLNMHQKAALNIAHIINKTTIKLSGKDKRRLSREYNRKKKNK